MQQGGGSSNGAGQQKASAFVEALSDFDRRMNQVVVDSAILQGIPEGRLTATGGPFLPSLICSINPPLTHVHTHPPTHAPTHPSIHSPSHPPMHSLTQPPPTHSLQGTPFASFFILPPCPVRPVIHCVLVMQGSSLAFSQAA